MTLIHVLPGEYGAMYPLPERIERTAPSAGLQVPKTQASLLEAVLISHASLKDSLLRPMKPSRRRTTKLSARHSLR